MTFEKKVEQTLRRECGFREGAKVVVACSGGADSTALLFYLCRNRETLGIKKLGVYHLNHLLRGSESNADQEFVEKNSSNLKLPFHLERADAGRYAGENGLSLEMAGRKLRYKGLGKLLESGDYDLAALGHTASDNAEWLLISLVRGRAEPLLWGIPARRACFIRPLIRCTRDEVLTYLKSSGLSWREDASNESVSFVRNFIRHRVIPILKEINPSIETTLSRTLELGDLAKESLDKEASLALEYIMRFSDQPSSSAPSSPSLPSPPAVVSAQGSGSLKKNLELDTSKLSQYNIATQIRVLRRFAPWLGLHDLMKILLSGSIRGTREIARGRGQRLVRSYGRLRLLPLEDASEWDAYTIEDLNKEVHLSRFGWRLKAEKGEKREVQYNFDSVAFDANEVKPPLTLRPWREGDKIIPFGHNKEIKIKKVFTEKKVPRDLRKGWPLLCMGESVLWIVGLMRSAVAPVTGGTKEIIIMTLLRGENG